MFKDGWVCRACWKPNRAGDERCYRCKTPRGEPGPDAAESPAAEAFIPRAASGGRLDTRFAFLALLVAVPLYLTAVMSALAAGLIVVLILMGGVQGNAVFGVPPAVAMLIFAVLALVFAALLFVVGKGVQRSARWAYGAALIIGLGGSLPRLLGVFQPSELVASNGAALYYGMAWLSLGIAAGAAILLGTSLVPPPQPKAEAQPEAASVE
jgi:hypothetical protein